MKSFTRVPLRAFLGLSVWSMSSFSEYGLILMADFKAGDCRRVCVCCMMRGGGLRKAGVASGGGLGCVVFVLVGGCVFFLWCLVVLVVCVFFFVEFVWCGFGGRCFGLVWSWWCVECVDGSAWFG